MCAAIMKSVLLYVIFTKNSSTNQQRYITLTTTLLQPIILFVICATILSRVSDPYTYAKLLALQLQMSQNRCYDSIAVVR